MSTTQAVEAPTPQPTEARAMRQLLGDHLRREVWSYGTGAIAALAFAAISAAFDRPSLWLVYLLVLVLAAHSWPDDENGVSRAWRALPLSRRGLGAVVWVCGVLVPPLLLTVAAFPAMVALASRDALSPVALWACEMGKCIGLSSGMLVLVGFGNEEKAARRDWNALDKVAPWAALAAIVGLAGEVYAAWKSVAVLAVFEWLLAALGLSLALWSFARRDRLEFPIKAPIRVRDTNGPVKASRARRLWRPYAELAGLTAALGALYVGSLHVADLWRGDPLKAGPAASVVVAGFILARHHTPPLRAMRILPVNPLRLMLQLAAYSAAAMGAVYVLVLGELALVRPDEPWLGLMRMTALVWTAWGVSILHLGAEKAIGKWPSVAAAGGVALIIIAALFVAMEHDYFVPGMFGFGCGLLTVGGLLLHRSITRSSAAYRRAGVND